MFLTVVKIYDERLSIGGNSFCYESLVTLPIFHSSTRSSVVKSWTCVRSTISLNPCVNEQL